MVKKNPRKKIANFWFWLGMVWICVPALMSIWQRGMYSLHDDLHVVWIDQMVQAIKSGQWPPRWVPDLSFGYGYPLFNFVYPLPFWLGALFRLSGFSLVDSLKLVFTLSVIGSSLSMFALARRHFGHWLGSLVTLVYVYTPYRALTLYVRGTIGEALVFVFLPLVMLGLEKAVVQGGTWLVWGGMSVAGLMLAHNIGAYMSLPFLFAYGLILAWRQKDRQLGIRRLVLAGTLSLGLGAFFWLPGIAEKKYMVEDTVYNYWDHFPFIKQLFNSRWGYGISTWGPYDEMSFQVGRVNWVAFFAAGLFLILNRRRTKLAFLGFFLLATMGISLFLMNIRSRFLWDTLPLLPYFQFPWRFLIMTTFVSPLLIPFGLKFFKAKPMQVCFGVILGLVAFGSTLGFFRPEKYFTNRDDAYYLRVYTPNRTPEGYGNEVNREYLNNTEDYLRLPVTTSQRPSKPALAKIEISDGEVGFARISAVEWEGEYQSSVGEELFLNQYWFPGWRLEINGQSVKTFPEGKFGRVAGDITEPEGEFRFFWTESPIRRVANLISFGTMIASLAIVLKLRRIHGTRTS